MTTYLILFASECSGCQDDCVTLRLAYTVIRCDDNEDDLHSIIHPGDSEEARFIRGSRAFSFGKHYFIF